MKKNKPKRISDKERLDFLIRRKDVAILFQCGDKYLNSRRAIDAAIRATRRPRMAR